MTTARTGGDGAGCFIVILLAFVGAQILYSCLGH